MTKATVKMDAFGWREGARDIIRWDIAAAKEALASKSTRPELREALARELARYRSMFGADAA